MSGFEDKDDYAWDQNPYYKEHRAEWYDYTGFYVAISICSIFAVSIILFNCVLCCCSPYKEYWRDPDTGNRFILPLWIRTPKNQRPLTLLPELSTINTATSPLV